ncbi:MAG: nuclear transport factor 2 family protein [Janthinobacterium lividum]
MSKWRLRFTYSALIFSLGSAVLPGQTQTPPASEQTLLKLQQDWAEARKHADLPFLESFYAQEFTVGDMNGREASRASDLLMFSSGDLKPSAIVDEQMAVHVYGSAALVTGVEHLAGTYKGHEGKFDLRFANTFVYRDGRWQIVRHQATPIAAR